jgi:Family of unknown function (DUF6489)
MKVTLEIDCTPAEAREFFGLPNVERVQKIMMEKIEQRIVGAADRFSPDTLMSTWLSLFPQNANWLQNAFADLAKGKSTER